MQDHGAWEMQRRREIARLGGVLPDYQRASGWVVGAWPTYEGYCAVHNLTATKYDYDAIIEALSAWLLSDLRAQAALTLLAGVWVREPDSREHDVARELTGWHLGWKRFAPEPPRTAAGDWYPVWKWKAATETNMRTARAVGTWLKRHRLELEERRASVLAEYAAADAAQ